MDMFYTVLIISLMAYMIDGQELSQCLHYDPNYNVVTIQCPEAHLLHIHQVIEGYTFSTMDTQCQMDPEHCMHLSESLTDQLRNRCDMEPACQYQFTLRHLPQCQERRGRNFIYVSYVCLPKQSSVNRESDIPILLPMNPGFSTANDIQVFLQSPGYPTQYTSYMDTMCTIKVSPDTVVLRVDIYDLSFSYDDNNSLNETQGNTDIQDDLPQMHTYCVMTKTQTQCAKNAHTFLAMEVLPEISEEYSYIRFKALGNETEGLEARFWIHLSALAANNQWAQESMTVTCGHDLVTTMAPPVVPQHSVTMIAVTESKAENPLLTSQSGLMIGASIGCVVALVLLIFLLAICCARRQSRRRSQYYDDKLEDLSVMELEGTKSGKCCPCIRSKQVHDNPTEPYAMSGIANGHASTRISNEYDEIPEEEMLRRSRLFGSKRTRRQSSGDSKHRHSYASIPERMPSYTTGNPLYSDIAEENPKQHDDVFTDTSPNNETTAQPDSAHGPNNDIYALPNKNRTSKDSEDLYAKPHKKRSSSQPPEDELVIMENDLYAGTLD